MTKYHFLLKLPLDEITRQNFSVTANEEYEWEKGYIIRQGNSLLFDLIERMCQTHAERMNELILVSAKRNPKKEEHLRKLLSEGFLYGGKRYLRFGRSASQGKEGITAFVREDIFDKLFAATQMDIPIKNCVISKYEAQRCLVFSTCTVIEDYMPNIVIIGEYEKTVKDTLIAYAHEESKEFTVPETGKKVTYKERSIKKAVRDIAISPFDGCGCHEEEFTKKISSALRLDYDAAGAQVRMPFIKGFSVYVPFRKLLKEMGCTEITDVYGKTHDIDTIDCIWNTSMFKGHKIFSEKYGKTAWEKYMETLSKYGFKLGISKYSHLTEDIDSFTRINFQYLQCLDLWNKKYIAAFEDKRLFSSYDILSPENEGKIISLAKYTTKLFENIIKGSKFHTFKFMGLGNSETHYPESTYINAVLTNDIMLKDPAVKRYIYRKLIKRISSAKTGKIYVPGFYSAGVGDMIGYLQYAAGLPVKGCLAAGEVYSGNFAEGKIVSFRSPLIDPSEVNLLNVNRSGAIRKYFSHFEGQDIVMYNMYDISMPQQGGADFDGDIFFLSNEPILLENKIEKAPVIDVEDKICASIKDYTRENITEYEISARDSRIGELTNIATSIENKYTRDKAKQNKYSDQVSLLRLYQGKEIDFLKTGIRWNLTPALRKHSKKIPYFLLINYPKKLKAYENISEKNKNASDGEKQPLGAYRSPSPMNELCEYISAWEKSIIWDRAFTDIADTRSLITNNTIDLSDVAIYRIVRRYANKYADNLKNRLSHETETDMKAEAKKSFVELSEEIKKETGKEPNEETIANYAISVCYRNISASKAFAWNCCGEYILKNLSQNSTQKRRTIISKADGQDPDTYEFLGKYYRMYNNVNPENHTVNDIF